MERHARKRSKQGWVTTTVLYGCIVFHSMWLGLLKSNVTEKRNVTIFLASRVGRLEMPARNYLPTFFVLIKVISEFTFLTPILKKKEKKEKAKPNFSLYKILKKLLQIVATFRIIVER